MSKSRSKGKEKEDKQDQIVEDLKKQSSDPLTTTMQSAEEHKTRVDELLASAKTEVNKFPLLEEILLDRDLLNTLKQDQTKLATFKDLYSEALDLWIANRDLIARQLFVELPTDIDSLAKEDLPQVEAYTKDVNTFTSYVLHDILNSKSENERLLKMERYITFLDKFITMGSFPNAFAIATALNDDSIKRLDLLDHLSEQSRKNLMDGLNIFVTREAYRTRYKELLSRTMGTAIPNFATYQGFVVQTKAATSPEHWAEHKGQDNPALVELVSSLDKLKVQNKEVLKKQAKQVESISDPTTIPDINSVVESIDRTMSPEVDQVFLEEMLEVIRPSEADKLKALMNAHQEAIKRLNEALKPSPARDPIKMEFELAKSNTQINTRKQNPKVAAKDEKRYKKAKARLEAFDSKREEVIKTNATEFLVGLNKISSISERIDKLNSYIKSQRMNKDIKLELETMRDALIEKRKIEFEDSGIQEIRSNRGYKSEGAVETRGKGKEVESDVKEVEAKGYRSTGGISTRGKGKGVERDEAAASTSEVSTSDSGHFQVRNLARAEKQKMHGKAKEAEPDEAVRAKFTETSTSSSGQFKVRDLSTDKKYNGKGKEVERDEEVMRQKQDSHKKHTGSHSPFTKGKQTLKNTGTTIKQTGSRIGGFFHTQSTRRIMEEPAVSRDRAQSISPDTSPRHSGSYVTQSATNVPTSPRKNKPQAKTKTEWFQMPGQSGVFETRRESKDEKQDRPQFERNKSTRGGRRGK